MKSILYLFACGLMVSCSPLQQKILLNTTSDIVKMGVITTINEHPETLGTFNLIAERIQELSQSGVLDSGYVESEVSRVVYSSDYKNAKTILSATQPAIEYYKDKETYSDKDYKEQVEILENISEGVSSACETYVKTVEASDGGCGK